jgi:type I restriction enzyme S subunit
MVPEYVDYLFHSNHHGRWLQQFITVGARAHGSLSVNDDDLLAMPVPRPSGKTSLSEQRKIAGCLSSLDELIEAESRKLEAMQAHKKGLMQQLFPREGETLPRLRFPEFKDGPEWAEKEVGDVFDVTRGQVLAMTLVQDEMTSTTPYPVYSSQTKNNGLAGYFTDYLYQDAITWTTDGANAGDVKFRHGRFYCTNVCGVLLNPDGFANTCVAALLNSVTRHHVSYVGNPKLMNGVMAKIIIAFPSIPEQQKIASVLSSLDELISAVLLRIEVLQTHKRGLMQQIFPSLEDDHA